MIRNHRPRGDRWNCPSAFQQTPAFRHVRYDECLAPEADILFSDHGDDFPPSQRAAKRRRVEQLADAFLNGLTLEIHSARLDPDALKAAVAYSSFPRLKDFRYAIDECEAQNDSVEVWEDVEDDHEIFRRLRGAKEADADGGGVSVDSTVSLEDVEVTEVQAQASCGPKRRLRSANASAGPSEEALRAAAALRDRKLRQTITAVPAESQLEPQSCPPPTIPETQSQSFDTSTDETASDCGPSPTPAWTSSKWLKTGAFKPQKHVDEDCSRDELGASSMFTLSQKSRTRDRPLARGKAGPSTATSVSLSTAPSGTARSGINESFVLRVDASGGRPGNDVTSADFNDPSMRAHGATEYQVALQDHAESAGDDEDDSQSRLPRRQGLRVAPRMSWVAMNDISEHTEEATFILPDGVDLGHGEANSAVNGEPDEPVAEDRQTKGRKAKSIGSMIKSQPRRSSVRRKSAPSKSQDAAGDERGSHRSKGQYIEVEVNGFSPLVLRKRGSELKKEQSTKGVPLQPAEPSVKRTPRRKVSFSSSSPGKPASAPPMHTPLVDEHLNTILPQATEPGRRSSSMRRALRKELEASGAVLSRCDDDGASQPEPNRGPTAAESQEVDKSPMEEPPAVPETQWPGTQAMLAQAQCDMFTSPEKSDTTLYLGAESTPQLPVGKRKAGRSARKPLKQLSQEPVALPSTQALLQDWQPWSSIKKPSVTREPADIVASPSLAKNWTPRSVSVTSPAIVKGPAARSTSSSIRSMEFAKRRRSSLRFSMSFSDTPEKVDQEKGASSSVDDQPKAASQPSPSLLHNGSENHDFTVTDLDMHSPKKTTKGIFSSMRLTGTAKSPVAGLAACGLDKPPPRRSSSDLKSPLNFGISSLDLPVHGNVDSQEETILPPGSQDSQTLTTSYPQAQQVLIDADSQDLARTITEMTTDVLGTADTFNF